ncbi:3522_t:CDS:2 [Rhizophagus irregularis]|nr:3522_t:CDS:2 [Rhizophagus irregularis]
MSESQFPRSQFSHFTEEEYDKWVEAGKPFEQHNELLVYLDQKLENGSLDDFKGMELALTVVSGRQTQSNFQYSRYTNQMLLDLQRDNILKDVISLNIEGRIREFKFDKASGVM